MPKILALAAAVLTLTTFAPAQEVSATDPAPAPLATDTLPDAPTQADAQGAPAPADGQQTKRILGVIPNFRSVSAGTTLPPQTVHEKFKTGLQDSFDYSAFIFAGAQAGVAQATNSYPEFHQGAAGYARYFWHTFADQADENLWVESILPSALHEDSRYYTLGRGSFFKRSEYALTRAVITRKDSGGETANVAEILGAGTAAAISTAYYPGQYVTWTKTGQRWLTNVILDTALLYTKEFWPDINRIVTHGKS